jgi:proteasome lid subunit RPN8/RPN11
MKKAAKAATAGALRVAMESEVSRLVRQHGRSSMKTEVCGVLIGREEGSLTMVDACIPGANAAQGGAHVTFTQDTWEHIYQVKDKQYPDARIVGWYHSHPGFGVFLSDHDSFIHQNFFASPRQIAWVYDPHSDEEGCFGWRDGEIVKLDDVSVRFAQPCGEVATLDDDEHEVVRVAPAREGPNVDWWDILRYGVISMLFLVFGAAGMFFYITSKAVLLPRGGSALVIVDDDKVGVVPAPLAERMLSVIQSETDPQMKLQPAVPSEPANPATDATGNGNAQGEPNGRQK